MQHQAYQPVLPCVNKYLQYRWDKNCYEMHRSKVKSAKPTINTTPPKTYNHLLVKLKKRQVGKLNYHQMLKFPPLGSEKRQLELLRITKDNQCLLQRLSTCRPRYSVQVWHEQWLDNLQLMETIGRYPRLYKAQGYSLPPISADRLGNVENKKTARNKHEGPADTRNERKECDEKTKSEHKATSSEDED
ncbi:hypothetical protein cypCar_00015576 [Cyprinus carpio]|nr:hypothetical protein cypCar_00015576 [Cyprinus carpio]